MPCCSATGGDERRNVVRTPFPAFFCACVHVLTQFGSLLSYAKFLECLIYSPAICMLSPPLCEHTSPPPRPWPAADTPLPLSRLNIVRHFACAGRAVTFSLSVIEDIFEFRVPKLQILKPRGSDKSGAASIHPKEESAATQAGGEEEKKTLRREIKAWWEGVADHMDKLVSQLGPLWLTLILS